MNKKLFVILPILLLILIAVAYVRLPAFREIVDTKAPWFKEKVGHQLLTVMPGGDPEGSSGGDAASPGGSGRPGAQSFDLAAFSAHPDSWPKSVAIKTEVAFPAVLDNKIVGSLRAPAGSEVHLVKVENGKLGVEYRGGGAWLAPEATDLSERVQAGIASHP